MSNNWFNILVNLVGTLCLVVHVFLIGMTQLNPTETHTTLETNTLDQMDLPVLFKICISPPANLTLLKSVGYKNLMSYILGRSAYNASIYGWAGHTPEGSPLYRDAGGEMFSQTRNDSIVFTELTRRLFSGPEDYVRYIHLKFSNNSNITMWKSSLQFKFNYPNNCVRLDLTNMVSAGNGLREMRVKFEKYHGVKAEIKIEDRQKSTDRSRRLETLSHSGSPLVMDLSAALIRYYAVSVEQNKYREDDPSKTCKDYTNSAYTYNHCDLDYVRERFKNLSPDFVPAWITQNSSQATVRSVRSPSFADGYKDLALGTEYTYTGCPPPCLETNIRTRLVEERIAYNYNKIEIVFSPLVKTYINDFPNFRVSSFLASVGGALGLWLGVGVQQMVDRLYQFIGTVWLEKSARSLL